MSIHTIPRRDFGGNLLRVSLLDAMNALPRTDGIDFNVPQRSAAPGDRGTELSADLTDRFDGNVRNRPR